MLQRRFEEAIDHFLSVQEAEGPSDAISSALAAAYHRLGFQTLAEKGAFLLEGLYMLLPLAVHAVGKEEKGELQPGNAG